MEKTEAGLQRPLYSRNKIKSLLGLLDGGRGELETTESPCDVIIIMTF